MGQAAACIRRNCKERKGTAGWAHRQTSTVIRLSIGVALVLSATVVTQLALAQRAACDSGALHLRLMTQGTATQANIDLRVTGLAAARCQPNGPVTFRIEQGGELARVSDNPITVSAHPGETWANGIDLAAVWWGNWCGPRGQILVEAIYRGRTVSSRLSFVPDCLVRSEPSALFVPQ
jgi:hypothetical protein